MTLSLLILGNPAEQSCMQDALAFAQQASAQGDELFRVFFYSDAVNVTMAGSQPELAENWALIAAQTSAELIACSSSAVRRGVLNEHEAKLAGKPPTLADGFELAGLGQLAEAILNSDRFATFGSQTPAASTGHPVPATANGKQPLVVITHDASKTELAMESLDLAMALAAFIPETKLLFAEEGVLQLAATPDSTGESANSYDHHKTLRALKPYGIEPCYVSAPCLQQRNLAADALCIECNALDGSARDAMIAGHSPVIRL